MAHETSRGTISALEAFLEESRKLPGAVLDPLGVIPTTLPAAKERFKKRKRRDEILSGFEPTGRDEPDILIGMGPLGGGKAALALTGASIVAEAAELDTALFNLLKGAFLDIAGFATGQFVGAAKGVIEGLLPGQQFADEQAEIGITNGGVNVPHPGQQIAVSGLQAGAALPSMGQIAKVWDTWPGAGVTGGGRAPIFIRTVDGRTFVRKLDGTIKKVPKSRNIVINTRKIDLNQYIRAERRLDTIAKRIAKRVRSLKRA